MNVHTSKENNKEELKQSRHIEMKVIGVIL